jgi:hypothetical protein
MSPTPLSQDSSPVSTPRKKGDLETVEQRLASIMINTAPVLAATAQSAESPKPLTPHRIIAEKKDEIAADNPFLDSFQPPVASDKTEKKTTEDLPDL